MKAKTVVPIAEAYVAGVGGTALVMRVDVAALSVQDRRSLFSTLIRDEAVVTAKPNTPEALAFSVALDGACKWGTS